MLKLGAGVAGAKAIEIAYSDLSREAIPRWRAHLASVQLVTATGSGQFAVRRARRELSRLLVTERVEARPGPAHSVLYLNANLWFGVKAGGSVSHVAGVVNALAATGYRVELYTATEPVGVGDDVVTVGLELPRTYALPPDANYFRFQPALIRQIQRNLASKTPTVLYQRLSLGNFAGVMLSRRRGLPLVIEYNGSEVWTARHWGGPTLAYPTLAEQAEAVSLQHAHLVVTVSNALRDKLLERGVAPERIACHPNGVDPTVYNDGKIGQLERAAVLAGHGIAADATVVTFAGSFGHWHGAEVLARAVAMAVDLDRTWLDDWHVRFVLVGDGVKAPEVGSILEQARAGRYVAMTGVVTPSEALGYLGASDVLVSPHVPNPDGSPFFGSPTKLFEYMAMGKAIVASDLEQIGDVLSPALSIDRLPLGDPDRSAHEVAVLATPGSAEELLVGIRYLVERPGWRKVLGQNARARVLARYTWRHQTAAVIEGLTRVFPERNWMP
ncbi:MAG: glycosyltransferase family 4 protein [Gaiellaceae bacterium]